MTFWDSGRQTGSLVYLSLHTQPGQISCQKCHDVQLIFERKSRIHSGRLVRFLGKMLSIQKLPEHLYENQSETETKRDIN